MYDQGGSCIYVMKDIGTKELNCFKSNNLEKEFFMCVIELLNYGYIILCIYIYMSPDSKFWTSFKIQQINNSDRTKKRKKFLMCGDWNLKFVLDNIKIQEIINLLESDDLINIVRSPKRITPSSESSIDVIVTNRIIQS